MLTNNQTLVSSQWLATQLTNPQVTIIDCRFQLSDPTWGYQQYLQCHIPGSYYLDLDRDLSAPIQKQGGRHPLPNPQRLAEKLAQMGIVQGETLVVAYDDARGAFASRLWWLLRYLGHESVALLNGGWTDWQSQYLVTAEIPPPRSGQFVPKIQANWIIERESVQELQEADSVVLVDSRDRDRYEGKHEPIDPIAGHIPGAINMPWKRVVDENGFWRSLDEQRNHWQAYQSSQELWLYCGSGVTACVNLCSLHQIGITHAKLYPGGWSDWCSTLI